MSALLLSSSVLYLPLPRTLVMLFPPYCTRSRTSAFRVPRATAGRRTKDDEGREGHGNSSHERILLQKVVLFRLPFPFSFSLFPFFSFLFPPLFPLFLFSFFSVRPLFFSRASLVPPFPRFSFLSSSPLRPSFPLERHAHVRSQTIGRVSRGKDSSREERKLQQRGQQRQRSKAKQSPHFLTMKMCCFPPPLPSSTPR